MFSVLDVGLICASNKFGNLEIKKKSLSPAMVCRLGEHVKGTGLRALLFETLDADFKRLFLDLRGRHYLDGGLIGCMLLSVVELASEFPAPPA